MKKRKTERWEFAEMLHTNAHLEIHDLARKFCPATRHVQKANGMPPPVLLWPIRASKRLACVVPRGLGVIHHWVLQLFKRRSFLYPFTS